jgi:hypothetical protein
MGIEFCVGQNTFWYTVAAQNGLVVHEELQSTGAGKTQTSTSFADPTTAKPTAVPSWNSRRNGPNTRIGNPS